LSAGKTISAYSGNEDEIGMPFEPCWERWTHGNRASTSC
jgi:hypothetical protein